MEHAKSKQLKLYTYLHKTTVSSMYMNILRFIQNQNIFTNKSNYKYKYVTTKENEVKHDIIIMAMQVWKTLVLPVFNSGIRAPNDCYKNYHKFGFTKEHLAKYAKHSMLWWRISVSFKQNSPTIQYKMQTPLHVVSFQAYTCGSTILIVPGTHRQCHNSGLPVYGQYKACIHQSSIVCPTRRLHQQWWLVTLYCCHFVKLLHSSMSCLILLPYKQQRMSMGEHSGIMSKFYLQQCGIQ